MSADTVRLLVVEDSPADFRLLCELLGECTAGCYFVDRAESLSRAIGELRGSKQYDLLLLDLSLPDSQGMETVDRCRETAPGLPIIVLTGLDSEQTGLDAIRSGAQDYVVKGQLDSRLLCRTITYALERKRLDVDRDRLMSELRAARDELDQRVQERTRELRQAVDDLRNEAVAREMAQYAVAAQARILEAFFSSTVNPIVFLDQSFNFIRVNEAYARACGREVADFVGRNHFEMYPSDAQQVFEEVVRTRKPFQTVARPFVFPDHPEWGVTYWDLSLVPVLDQAGDVDFLVFSLNDVTTRKKAEDRLRESEQKFRAIFERAAIGVALARTDGKIVETNHAFQAMLGFEAVELAGMSLLDLIHEADRSRVRALSQRLTTGERDSYEVDRRCVRKDGRVIRTELILSLLRGADGQPAYTLALMVDVTERRRTEKQMAEAMVAEQQRLGQELHDGLVQQLTGLGMMAKSLQEKLRNHASPFVGAAEEFCLLVRQAQEQGRAMLKGLRPVEVDAAGLVAAIEDLATGIERWYHIPCSVRMDRPVRVEDSIVATQLFYIVREAVTNAVRHANAQHIEILLQADDDSLTVSVADDGGGLPQHPATSGGMGLRIMKYRAGLIGGTLDIEPARQNGTVVTCTLWGHTQHGSEQTSGGCAQPGHANPDRR